jgi:uncharacterized protein YjdB
MAPRRSWCVRVLLVPVLLAGCSGGEDEVGPRVPASIVVVPNEPKVPLGGTTQLTATVVDAAGRAIPDQPLTFVSGSPEVITVSARGLLTAVGSVGSSHIEVASGQLTGSVEAAAVLPPSAIVVEPRTLELQLGQIVSLGVVVTNELSQVVFVPVTFATSNPTIASVDQSGSVTGVHNGTAKIVVSSDGREDVEVPVTVAQIPTTLQVTPTNLVLSAGESQPLTSHVLDAFGQVIPGKTVTYASNATGVATVSSAGVVHAVAKGSAVITATSDTLSATVGVFVGDIPPGTVVATVPLDGSPWGARVVGNRFFVTGISGRLYGGAGTSNTFPTAVDVGGQELDVAVNAAGTRAYVASLGDLQGEGIAVVDLATEAVVDVLHVLPASGLLAVALSPDESVLFVGTGEGAQRLVLASGDATEVTGVAGSITAFSRHPTLPRLYGNLGYAKVVEIDMETSSALRTFDPADFGVVGTVQATAVSPDGKRLFAETESGDLMSWNLETGQPDLKLAGGGGFGLAISPDGKVLYVGSGGSVLLVDPASLTLLKTVNVGGLVRRVAVRADGTAVAANEQGWVDFIR